MGRLTSLSCPSFLLPATIATRGELLHLAEDPKRSPTVESLTAACKKGNFYLITGFAERAEDKIFNSALLIGPQGHLHTYRKLHLFHNEKDFFEPGDIPSSSGRR